MGELTLSQLSLGGNETKEVDLSELLIGVKNRDDLDVVSLEITNWSAPGSVIGSIYATNDRRGIAYDVPLRDSGPVRSMTGAYPWRIDSDYKSLAYVTNITDEPVEYVVELAYNGGKFTLGPRKLQARETATYDPESIRDQQTKDAAGITLPANVTQGQFRWAIRGTTGGRIVLIGRTEMVSRTEKVSSSFSCPMDCGPIYDAWLTEFPGNMFIGQSGMAAAVETATWNWGYTMGPYSVSAGWTATPSLVEFAAAGADTLVTGSNEGTTNLSALVSIYDRYDWDGLNCVYLGTFQNFVGGILDILALPHRFVALTVTDTDLGCAAGSQGWGVQVKYVVTSFIGLPITQPGMTPRERVSINGIPQHLFFLPFATPQQTDSQGTFNDIPVGSCFGNIPPASPFNPCVTVTQNFDLVVPNDPLSPYSMITVTTRKDCRLGIRVQVENGGITQTFTRGLVPD